MNKKRNRQTLRNAGLKDVLRRPPAVPPEARRSASAPEKKHAPHPGRVFAICMGVFAAVTAGTIGFYAVFGSGSDYATAVSESADLDLSDVLETEVVSSFYDAESEGTIATVRVRKTEPDTVVSYGNIGFGEEDGYLTGSIPQMGFDVEEVYVSVPIDGQYTQSELKNRKLKMEGYAHRIADDYAYLVNRDNPSIDEIRNAWKAVNAGYEREVTVVDDGRNGTPGEVIYRVSTKDGSHTYLDGDVDILFKKDGEVVYADVDNFYAADDQRSSLTEVYHADYSIPDYDEVEVIYLPDEL